MIFWHVVDKLESRCASYLVDCNSWLAFKFSGALRLGSGRTDKTNSVRGEVLEP